LLIRSAVEVRTGQELLGHAGVAINITYTYVLKVGSLGLRSPVNALPPTR